MKIVINSMAMVLVAAVLVGLGTGLYYGGGYLWHLYMMLEFTLRIITTAVVAAILLGASIVAAGFRMGARIQARSQLSTVRHELYAAVIDHYRTGIHALVKEDAETCHEALDHLDQLDTDLGLLAGGPTLRAHERLLEAMISEKSDPKQLERRLLDLMRGFRRDLGHSYAFEETLLTDLILPEQPEKEPTDPAVSLTAVSEH